MALSEAYHFTPQQIGELTLAQFFVYLGQLPDPGAIDREKDAGDRGQETAQHRADWIAWQKRNLACGI